MVTKSVCFVVMLRKSRLFFQITGRFFLLSLRPILFITANAPAWSVSLPAEMNLTAKQMNNENLT